MSKRQEKIQARKEEQQAFIQQRRAKQIALLEQNYAAGVQMLEDSKEKLSQDDIKLLEKEMNDQRSFIDKIRADWKIDGPTGS